MNFLEADPDVIALVQQVKSQKSKVKKNQAR
jgi:hypothetical protein